MPRRGVLIVCAILAVSLLAVSPTVSSSWLFHTTEHFRILHTEPDGSAAVDLGIQLELHHRRITGDLQPSNMPVVDIWVYHTPEEFRRAVGIIAADQKVVGVAQRYMIRMISPNYNERLNYQGMLKVVLHEFVHCIVYHQGGNFVPRWLNESVAQYYAGAISDLNALDYIVADRYPTLAELNRSNSMKVYEVGYTIAEFIAWEWGVEALRDLIINRGNVQKVLKISEKEFEKQWREFIIRIYQPFSTTGP